MSAVLDTAMSRYVAATKEHLAVLQKLPWARKFEFLPPGCQIDHVEMDRNPVGVAFALDELRVQVERVTALIRAELEKVT